MNTRNQILSIQILRAVAAWIVVLHHMGREFDSSFAEFFAQQGNFGVDIFFVISGFVMYYIMENRDQDAKEFILNRLFRIVPAYWVATFFLIISRSLMPNEFHYTDWSVTSLISSLLFIPVDNPSGIGPFPPLVVGWTLNVEIFFYILLCFCFLFGRRWRFLVCCAILFCFPIIWDREWFYGSVLGTRKLYEFVFGITIGFGYLNFQKAREWIQDRPWIGMSLIPPVVAFLYLDRDGMRLLAAVGLVTAFLLLEPMFHDSKIVGVLTRMGEVSYSTYLLHYIVIGVVIFIFGRPTDAFTEVVEWLVLIVLVTGFSFLGYEFIENNRHINAMKRRLL